MAIRLFVILTGAFAASPLCAHPAMPTAIPEPTDAALLLVGLVGLWLGRRASRKRPPRD